MKISVVWVISYGHVELLKAARPFQQKKRQALSMCLIVSYIQQNWCSGLLHDISNLQPKGLHQLHFSSSIFSLYLKHIERACCFVS